MWRGIWSLKKTNVNRANINTLKANNNVLNQSFQRNFSVDSIEYFKGFTLRDVSKNFELRKKYFEYIEKELNITSKDLWYTFTFPFLSKNYNGTLISQYYEKNLFKALREVFPDYNWLSEYFNQSNISYKHNRKRLLQRIEKDLNVQNNEDWYKVPYRTIMKVKGGAKLLNYYKCNIIKLLEDLKEDFEWKICDFHHFPRNFWQKKENIVLYVHYLEKYFNMTNLDHWYQLRNQDIHSASSGSSFLTRSNGNVLSVLQSVYPNYPWDTKEFVINRRNYWKDCENHRYELEKILKELNITNLDDCYKITAKRFIKAGGRVLLKNYDYNLFRLLNVVYPNHNWDPLKMKTRKKEEWSRNGDSLSKKLLLDVQRLFVIKQQSDWYSISNELFTNNFRATSIFAKGGLYFILSKVYPTLSWNKMEFRARGKKTKQRWLYRCLEKIFPKFLLLFDYNSENIFFNTGYSIEIDVFIPQLNMGFEYHGEQHYDEQLSSFSPIEVYAQRDVQKKQLCEENDIQLIIIPYWWDKSESTLSQFIPTF